MDFRYEEDGFSTTLRNKPEVAVAYPERLVRSLYGKSGLKILEPIHYGSWCGRRNFLSYQDLVIAVKGERSIQLTPRAREMSVFV